jgi:hypothetical protein
MKVGMTEGAAAESRHYRRLRKLSPCHDTRADAADAVIEFAAPSHESNSLIP